MAGQIRITPDEMRTRATEFRKAKEEYDHVIGAMNSLIGRLKEEWEGAASVSFSEQFDSLKPSFDRMAALILEIAQQCDDVANATESLDEEIAGKFSK